VAASSLLAFAVRKVETMERMTGYRRTRRMSAVAVQAL
jgi:cobalamin biosynthesis protein CobD/CbiB